ncbi:MAG: hypothetical protein GX974_00455 [Clostridiales bacterium]|nr:hypothetical protein [Clostridiales bacterium]
MKRLLLIFICMLFFLTSCISLEVRDIKSKSKKDEEQIQEDTPQDVLNLYFQLWSDGKYNEMYDLLSLNSRETITKTEFVDRYEDIFTDIGIVKIQAKITDNIDKTEDELKDPQELKFNTSVTFYTNTVPTFEQVYPISMAKEGDSWKVIWSQSLLFPNMRANHTIEVNPIPRVRGSILDRYGNPIAEYSEVYTVGAVPQAIPNIDEFVDTLAPIIDVSTDYIKKQLNQTWVKADTFVPLRSYPLSISQEFKDEVLSVKGVMLSSMQKSARQYIKGEQFAHITGYVQGISEELLEKLSQKGYTKEDIVGKQGIEAVMEDILRQKNGYIISRKKNSDEQAHIVAEYDGEDGNNVVLTIDPRLQDICYRAMEGHKGSIVAMHPSTGEVLALLSQPAFDPNLFSFGISQADWDELSNNKDYPLVNRTVKGHIPGSTIKPFIAAMALDEGIISKDTIVKEAEEREWYPTSDWGSHPIKRVDHPKGEVNLRNALVWSDNIYFAWTGLKLGSIALEDYFTKYGFGEQIPFELSIDTSIVKNKDTKWSDHLLADTAYGQGEMLLSPIHLTTLFTSFFNNGNILVPKLIREVRDSFGKTLEPFEVEVWKENAMEEKTVNVLYSYLIDVVEDESGTAHDINIPGLKIGAKTGTAQLGSEKKDELGWVVAFTANVENPVILSLCLEVPAGAGSEKFKVIKDIFTEYYDR